MRQHLANAVFRAVENGRPLLRVTNTGITAYITARGDVRDQTEPFQPAVRVWTASQNPNGPTIYTRFGDVLVLLCAIVVAAVFVITFVKSRRAQEQAREVLAA
jgi:apolipoprotein N-acyltransferase